MIDVIAMLPLTQMRVHKNAKYTQNGIPASPSRSAHERPLQGSGIVIRRI
jgi:hypothetical protein